MTNPLPKGLVEADARFCRVGGVAFDSMARALGPVPFISLQSAVSGFIGAYLTTVRDRLGVDASEAIRIGLIESLQATTSVEAN